MDFKEEYKNEMQRISPSEEQCERIRAGVMQRLSENVPVKRKKPPYLRITAVSGAAVCAAAVAIVIFSAARVNLESNFSGNAMAPSANDSGYGITDKDFSFDTNLSLSSGATSGYSPDGEGAGNGNDFTQSAAQESSKGGNDIGGPTAEPPTATPYLTFSEDKSSCDAKTDGIAYTYYIAENDSGSPYSGDEAAKADSNLDTELFVQFDENIMTVFYKDGSLFGVYVR